MAAGGGTASPPPHRSETPPQVSRGIVASSCVGFFVLVFFVGPAGPAGRSGSMPAVPTPECSGLAS